MIERGQVYWADLGQAIGSRPAKRRPVLIIQSDAYNKSDLLTVIAATVTSNTALAGLPSTVFLPAVVTRLPQDSVVNVTSLVTLNKSEIGDRIGEVSRSQMEEVDRGLRHILQL